MALTNRQLRLQSRPKGLLAPGDLQLAESPVPELKDGEALAKVKYLSIDPTMRVWMAMDSYLPAVAIGEVMRAGGLAEVVESKHPQFKKGDKVFGLTGFQEYADHRSAIEDRVPENSLDSVCFRDGISWRAGNDGPYGLLWHDGSWQAEEGRNDGRFGGRGCNGKRCGADWQNSRLPRGGDCGNGRKMCVADRGTWLRCRDQLQAF